MKLDVLYWLLAAVLPGAALIRLCWPQAGPLRTIACAPPVSFGFCYLIGLAASRLSLSPVPAVLVASALVLIGAGLLDLRRRRTGRPSAPAGRTSWLRAIRRRPAAQLVSGVLLLAGMALGVLQWRSFQSSMLVPVGWDAMHHGYFIAQISRHHTMSASVVLSSDAHGHDGSTTFYPLAFNLVAAVLHVSTGSLISSVMLASTAALGGVLLPLGTFALARELDADQPLVAGFAAIASILPVMLYLIEGTGRLTGILGVALVPGLAVLLLAQWRSASWISLPLPALGIVGIVGVHTSEAPTAVLLATACMLVRLKQSGDWTGLRHWLAWVIAAGVAGMVVLVVLEPNVLHLVSERGGAIVGHVNNGRRATLASAGFALGKAWVVPVLGCAATLLRPWRRYRGATITLAGLGLLFYGVATGVGVLVPTLAIPWYGDAGRISWDLTVLGAIPTAVALVAIGGLLGRPVTGVVRFIGGVDRASVAAGRIRRWTPPVTAAVAGLLVVLAFLMPPVHRDGRLTSLVAGPVDRNSVAAFQYLSATVPHGQYVLDDLRSDGAMWMYVDHNATPLFGNSPLLGYAPHSWLEKLWLSRNLNRIDTDPCVQSLISKYSIHYVYVGERHIIDGWTDFSVAKMRADPAFTEVFDQGLAHVFRVELPNQISPCTRDITSRIRW